MLKGKNAETHLKEKQRLKSQTDNEQHSYVARQGQVANKNTRYMPNR